MAPSVADWCSRCVKCSARKAPNPRPRAPLIQEAATFPFERVAIDITGPFPTTERGHKYILVVSDYFTRWVEAFPLKTQESKEVANSLVHNFFSRYGIPSALHSDQGRTFESNVFQEMCSILGIRKTRTSPYHPQSDGLVERFNRTLMNSLSAYVNDTQTDWDIKLPLVMMSYRSNVHESTGYSPHYLLFG